MKKKGFLTWVAFPIVALYLLYGGVALSWAEDDAVSPRVPPGEIASVKVMKNTVTPDEASIAAGRAIYFGKGVCFNCHGDEGRGDGPGGASFEHKPRDFGNVRWQRARTDGEIFWAISEGTDYGMLPFGSSLSETERWHLVNYLRFLGKVTGKGALAGKIPDKDE